MATPLKLETLTKSRHALDLIATRIGSSISTDSVVSAADSTPPEVDTLSSDYVALMLCEAYGGLQSCALAVTKTCAATEIGNYSLMRYMRPVEWESFRLTGVPPDSTNTLCYLCLLRFANAVAVLVNTKGTNGTGFHTPFYHYVNAPGGYMRDAMEGSGISPTQRHTALFGLVRNFSNDDYYASSMKVMGPVPDPTAANKVRMVCTTVRCLKEVESVRCMQRTAAPNVLPLASGGCIVPRCEELLAADLHVRGDGKLTTELLSEAICDLTNAAYNVLGTERASSFVDLNKPFGCDIPSAVEVLAEPGSVDTAALRSLLCFCDIAEGRIKLVHAIFQSKADRDFSLLTRHSLLPHMLKFYVVPLELQFERTMLGVLTHTTLILLFLRLDEICRLQQQVQALHDDVKHRLRVYYESLMPMLAYFQNAALTGMPLDDVHLFESGVDNLIPFYRVRPRPQPVYFSATHVANMALVSAEAKETACKETLKMMYSSLAVALDFVDDAQVIAGDTQLQREAPPIAWRMRRELFAGEAPWSITDAACALFSCQTRSLYSPAAVNAIVAGVTESRESAQRPPGVEPLLREILEDGTPRSLPWIALLLRIEVLTRLLQHLAPHAERHCAARYHMIGVAADALIQYFKRATARPGASVAVLDMCLEMASAVGKAALPATNAHATQAYALEMPLRKLLAVHMRALRDLTFRYEAAVRSGKPCDSLELASIHCDSMFHVESFCASPRDVWPYGPGPLAQSVYALLYADVLSRMQTQTPQSLSITVLIERCSEQERSLLYRIFESDQAGIYECAGTARSLISVLRNGSAAGSRRLDRYVSDCVRRAYGGLDISLVALSRTSLREIDVVRVMSEACAHVTIKIGRDASLVQGSPVSAKQLVMPRSVVENVEFFARRLWALRVPFSWDLLEALGLPASTAQILRPALEVRKPNVIVRELAIAHPEQFAVAALFFDMLMRYRRRTVTCLDAGFMRRQLVAAHVLNELPRHRMPASSGCELRRGQPIGVVGSVLCCDRILTITAQVDPAYRGLSNVHTSLDTGVMACKLRAGRQPAGGEPDNKRTCKAADHAIKAYRLLAQSSMPLDSLGKARRHEALDQLWAKARKDAQAHSTVVCKTLLHLPCGREPLLLPVVGHVVEVTSTSGRVETLTMCPRCCRMTAYSLAMFGPNGFTCGACDASVRQASRGELVGMTEPRCYFCNSTQIEAAHRAQDLSKAAIFTGLVAFSRYNGCQTMYMCSCCFKPWIYHTTQYVIAEDIRQMWRAQEKSDVTSKFDELCDSAYDANAKKILELAIANGSLLRSTIYPAKALSFTVESFAVRSSEAEYRTLTNKTYVDRQVAQQDAVQHRRAQSRNNGVPFGPLPMH